MDGCATHTTSPGGRGWTLEEAPADDASWWPPNYAAQRFLAVASACDTGIGEVRVGEGVLGLRRAFQQAGARTVVSSLWKVPDEQTMKMMPRFLDLWLSGTPKAEALRQSQLEMIRELRASQTSRHRDAPPLFWAAFVCHGMPE